LFNILMDIYEDKRRYTEQDLKDEKIDIRAIPFILTLKPKDEDEVINILAYITEKGWYIPSKHPLGEAYDIGKNKSSKHMFNIYSGKKSNDYPTKHIHLSFNVPT
ncbi:MAG: hypothetical protein ACRCWI_01745, partial [Brevinema sp.]